MSSLKQTDTDADNDWEPLTACTYEIVSNPILINGHQILFIVTTPLRLATYDTITSKWKELTALSDEIDDDPDALSICFDNTRHKLYAYGEDTLFTVDLLKKSTQIVHRAEVNVGAGCFSLFVEDKFHLFGGENSDKHYTYNKSKDKLQEMYSFKNEEAGQFARQKQYINGHHVLYLSKKDIILMMGGDDDYGWEILDKIYCYDCKVKKWNLLKLKMPVAMDLFGCIATKDEKYIITFCGYDATRNGINRIYIFDMDAMNVYLSSICCPIHGAVYATLAGDERMNTLIVTTYIKSLWKLSGFNKMIFPCQDIINFIAVWYGAEYVYLMQRGKSYKHYRIMLDDILCSKKSII